MNVWEKLLACQAELKAPKSQYNAFGKYNYRNCEDILEALKPILVRNRATVFLTDEGIYREGRHYVEAAAVFVDIESGEKVTVKAAAREEENKKGMDGSQVTGASSSYARKYALNGLFLIDDNKDPDYTLGMPDPVPPPPTPAPTPPPADKPSARDIARNELIKELMERSMNIDAYAAEHGLNRSTPVAEIERMLEELRKG